MYFLQIYTIYAILVKHFNKKLHKKRRGKLNKTIKTMIWLAAYGVANNTFAHQEYYGEWVGEATQMNNNSHWHISMSLNANKLLIRYPTLNCSGYLEFLEEKNNRFIFREHITENKNRCTDKGTIHLKKVTNNKLDWEYYEPNGSLNAKTQVTRKSNALSFLSQPQKYQKELMANGLWYDQHTGLIWDRCSVGQTWNGSACEGIAHRTTFETINKLVAQLNSENYLGSNQWKIPTILQLHTLIRCQNWDSSREIPSHPFSGSTMKVWAKCAGTSSNHVRWLHDRAIINETIFPNLPRGSASYSNIGKWSHRYYYSSNKDNQTGNYWGSDIDNGHIYTLSDSYNHARLVIDTHSKDFKIYQDLLFNKHNQKLQKARNELQNKIANFRKNLKVGDDASTGIVIEIKGNLVKIQTNDSQCSQRDYKHSCINWITTPVEKWVKRNQLYPAH